MPRQRICCVVVEMRAWQTVSQVVGGWQSTSESEGDEGIGVCTEKQQKFPGHYFW